MRYNWPIKKLGEVVRKWNIFICRHYTEVWRWYIATWFISFQHSQEHQNDWSQIFLSFLLQN